jgi:hypothetical protein
LPREELIALVSAQAKLIQGLRAQGPELEAEVAELKRQAGRNSQNSADCRAAERRWPEARSRWARP